MTRQIATIKLNKHPWGNSPEKNVSNDNRILRDKAAHDATPSEKKNYRMRYRNTPPFTSPLVLIALRLSVVMTQTTADSPIMPTVWRMPACATTHESRRKSITPHMFSRHGMRTPCIHPNFIPPWPCWPTALPTCPVSIALASWNSIYLEAQLHAASSARCAIRY